LGPGSFLCNEKYLCYQYVKPKFHNMKRTLLPLLLLLPAFSFCQTVFWTETFNNGCTSGCLANTYTTGTNGAWTVASSGTNGSAPNQWFISCAENGNAPGACGTGCAGNATLHIGANALSECTCLICADPAGDCGASYDADGPGACLGLCAGGGTVTNTRAISPTISTSGKTGISIQFDYIEAGQTAHDFASVWYSIDNGANWLAITNPLAKTTNTGCSGQGKWATYTSANLPATADDISTLKISIIWQNDADNTGTDPSVAINDLKVRYTALVPVSLQTLSAIKQGNDVKVQWTTATEVNSNYFEVMSSTNASSQSQVMFQPIGRVAAAGTTSQPQSYTFVDHRANKSGTYYYRLNQVDKDGKSANSNIVAVNFNHGSQFNLISVSPNPYNSKATVQLYMNQRGTLKYKLFDVAQRQITSQSLEVAEGNFSFDIDKDNKLPSGVYFVHLMFNDDDIVTRVVKR
jgi:hypothetical protein